MLDGGDLSTDKKTPGLDAGTNVLFNNPSPNLAPGTDSERPIPDPSMYNRLRYNYTLEAWEYYNSIIPAWVQLESSIGIQDFPFVIYKDEPQLPFAFNLGALSTGLLKLDVTTGEATPVIAVNDVDYYGPGMTGYLQAPSGIADNAGNPILRTQSPGSLAANYFSIVSSLAGNPIIFIAEGSDTDIKMVFGSKGTGSIIFETEGSEFSFTSGTSHQHTSTFIFPTSAFARDIIWQDADGTVAYLSDIPPITLPLPMLQGGTGAALVAVAGSIPYSGASAMALLAPAAQANMALLSQSPGNPPNWSPFRFIMGGDLITGAVHTLSGSFASTFTFTNTTSVTFPTSGTLATTAQLPTPAALTRTNDTNVTLTLGGTPATALLQAASLTLGWTGQLGLTRGGTNASLTAANGGVVSSTGSALSIGSATATANQMFLSGSNTPGSWSTNTWPPTSAISSLLYASATNVISNLGPQINGALVTSASGVPSWLTAGTAYSPVVSFFVPGDLSVVYTSQIGTYWRIANLIFVRMKLVFIPTFTTSASGVTISVPVAVGTNGDITGVFYTSIVATNNIVYPVGRTIITPMAQPGSSTITLVASGVSGIATAGLDQTNIPSTVQQSFEIFCLYFA